MDIRFSYFQNLRHTTPDAAISVEDFVQILKLDSKVKEICDKIRISDKKENGLKEQLTCVTFSGIFEKRTKAGCTGHSGLIVLDYDNLPDAHKWKAYISQFQDVMLAFISPGGKGVKVVIYTNATIETHEEVFADLARGRCSVDNKVDPSGRDVCRVCYSSHDPEPYFNPTPKQFIYHPIQKVVVPKPAAVSINMSKSQWWWWPKFLATQPSGLCDTRNLWLKLAMAIKAAGLPFEDFDYLASRSKGYKGTEDCFRMWDREQPRNTSADSLYWFASSNGFLIKDLQRR